MASKTVATGGKPTGNKISTKSPSTMRAGTGKPAKQKKR